MQYMRCQIAGQPITIAAIADGAGSASFSHLAAEEVVKILLRQAASTTCSVADISRDVVQAWFANAQLHLQEVAALQKIELAELDCTALLALLAEDDMVFAQIGDGAWIAEKDGIFGAVTWPQNGEFANETIFITSPSVADLMQFQRCRGPLTSAAGFTDGLQALALDIATKTAHPPFFGSMLAALRDCEDETSLLSPLITFLSSERVNQRTDDDKTLLLAQRLPAEKSHDVVAG